MFVSYLWYARWEGERFVCRKNFLDIYFASMQRVKESLRVLEEFAKLKDKQIAVEFKHLRYSLYSIERKSARAFGLML